ncbi:hypothetical protein D0T84_04270 [Dysgonomonas sp. 521]|nr:hypothetical protein [Dysgonomonas sp. 521]
MIYILNYIYPLFLDDWTYNFVFMENERVSSLSDILVSQYNHYFTWGGRTVVHIICQALLLLDFFWICVLNAAAYVALLYVMYSIANKNNKVNPFVFFLCHVCVWFLQLAFCQTVLWKTGSANYLWGMLIVLLFMYPYYIYFRNREYSNGVLKVILFFIIGIIAGWTNENIGLALIFYILACLFLYRREKMKLPGWAISGLIGAILGCGAMLLAPGNYERLASVEQMVAEQGGTMLGTYLFNLKNLLKYSALTVLPLLMAYIAGLIIYKRQKQDNKERDMVIKSSLLFLATAFIALFALMASPASEKRAMFGIIVLFIIPALQIYANLDFSIKPLKVLNIIMLTVLLLYYAVDYTWKYQTIHIASTAWKEREPIIEDYKNRGVDTVTFTNRFQIHVKYGLQDLSDDPENLVNVVCSRYYGFKWMKAVDSDSEK